MSHDLVLGDSPAGCANPLPSDFVCSWTNRGLDAAWAHLDGELDLATVAQLEVALSEPQARLVVLDLRELTFMDSSGVHTIVNASIRARDRGRRLVLLRGPPHVDRLFALTGTLGEVEIYDLDPAEPPAHVLIQLAGGAPA